MNEQSEELSDGTVLVREGKTPVGTFMFLVVSGQLQVTKVMTGTAPTPAPPVTVRFLS